VAIIAAFGNNATGRKGRDQDHTCCICEQQRSGDRRSRHQPFCPCVGVPCGADEGYARTQTAQARTFRTVHMLNATETASRATSCVSSRLA
jgi:hypothetical protein